MSNLSVLERLEESLANYEQGEISRQDFLVFLSSSIKALEGAPYSVTTDLGAHESNIETEEYFDNEEFWPEQIDAKAELKAWLQELKTLYGTSSF